MEANHQKIKMLKILEMLRCETDEQHPMSTSQICMRLKEMGISCERRTVTKDMTLLNDEGYEVMSTRLGHEKAYYIEDRAFSIPELKILIDAVQAASFITNKKTMELTDKLASLGGSHRAELLKGNLVRFNTRKHRNEAVYYTIQYIESAINNGNQLSFCYFDLNERHERVYRKEKKRYIMDPLMLIFIEDNYYLICYHPKYQSTTNYRMDRMVEVMVEASEISAAAKMWCMDPGAYTEQVFKMFDGAPVQVELAFDDHLIGAVYDKFGEDISIARIGEHCCRACLVVRVSPTFFGWLFQFGSQMEIRHPEELRQKYRTMAAQICEQHSESPI